MTFREIASVVLAASPAAETEVVYQKRNESLTRFANNHIHQNVTETNFEIAVRCVLGTRVGMAVSNNLGSDSLKSMGKLALDLAKQQPENPEFKGLPRGGPHLQINAFDSRVAGCAPALRASEVGIACRKAREAGYTAAGSMTTGTLTLGVANSHGLFAERESTVVDASTVVMTPTSSGWAQSSGWSLSAVRWEEMADEAVRKARMGENPAECPAGTYAVILDPYVTADLLEMMAIDGMSALAVQEERSWINGRIGQKVLSERITIVDDGLDPAGIPSPFDYEGQPKKPVFIVENGICRAAVHDSYTAGRESGGVQSTGHAMEPSPTDRYGPLPLNLFLKPGTSNVDDMISSTELGLYITRFWYTRTVHPRDVVVTGMTRDGTFMVRDGEIVGPVKSMRFTQSYLEALAGTAAVGQTVKVLRSGPSTVSVPALKLDKFQFTSATR
jgi:predicted Zn-dependent protease